MIVRCTGENDLYSETGHGRFRAYLQRYFGDDASHLETFHGGEMMRLEIDRHQIRVFKSGDVVVASNGPSVTLREVRTVKLSRIVYDPHGEIVMLESLGGRLYALVVAVEKINRYWDVKSVYVIDPTSGRATKIITDIDPVLEKFWHARSNCLVAEDLSIYGFHGFKNEIFPNLKSYATFEDWQKAIYPDHPLPFGTQTLHVILARRSMSDYWHAVARDSKGCLLSLTEGERDFLELRLYSPDLSEMHRLGCIELRRLNHSLPMEMWLDERRGLLYINNGSYAVVAYSVMRKCRRSIK